MLVNVMFYLVIGIRLNIVHIVYSCTEQYNVIEFISIIFLCVRIRPTSYLFL